MKLTRLFLLATVFAVAVSCSKDDDPKPVDVEDAQLSFTTQEEIIQLPDAFSNLEGTDNEQAIAVVWATSMVNLMTTNFGYFEPPAGAQKSTDLITVSTGRTAARKGVVWYWSYDGQSIAYQIAEDGSKYTFEIFFKFSAESDWKLFVRAEENKDRSAGSFAVYEPLSDDNYVQMRWTWTRKGDEVTIKLYEGSEHLFLEVTSNNKTKAGKIVFYTSNVKTEEITWDGNGSGTWARYDDEGTEVESGDWSV